MPLVLTPSFWATFPTEHNSCEKGGGMASDPLHTPRSAIGLALVGVVLAIGSPWAPAALFWPAMVLCYVAAGATVYLCRGEFKGILDRFLRRPVHQHKLPSDFWVVSFLLAIQLGFPTYLIVEHLRAPGDEDLRASFQMEASAQNEVQVTYIVMNFGKHPVLVNSIGLYELVAKNNNGDPAKNIELCDTATPASVFISELASAMNGGGRSSGREIQKFLSIGPPKLNSVTLLPI